MATEPKRVFTPRVGSMNGITQLQNSTFHPMVRGNFNSEFSLTIAVAGNPNAGKTSLFNALSGLRQKVANYPGVTVECKTGLWSLQNGALPAKLIDLPGLYSLDATSIDEQIARDVLVGKVEDISAPDVIVAVVDATNLVRNLYLVTQLIDTRRPVVVALTMSDLAARNKLTIDPKKLSERLGVPVIPVVARQRRGLEELRRAVLCASSRDNVMTVPWRPIQSDADSATHNWSNVDAIGRDSQFRKRELIARYRWIEQVAFEVEHHDAAGQSSSITDRIDAVITHKVLGPVILSLVMLLIFQTIFSWANLPMNLIDSILGALGEIVRTHLASGLLNDLIVDGVIAGVGGVLVFLPQILLLFFFISILEDSGYMARAAFLMDRLMRSVGLHGRAFMPLLSSFACAVPGIMATRTIENPKDRLATIMIAPFMSCSARLPVYTLMIASFFSAQKIFGILSMGVFIILGMYGLGLSVAIIVARILKSTILKGPPPPFVMEMPPYRLPNPMNVAHTMVARAAVFLKRAGTVILAISILLWALMAFPRATHQGSTSSSEQVQNSFAGQSGRLIEPLITPLGFDWKIGIGLISSFAARETIVSTLSIVYNVGNDSDQKSSSLVDAMRNAKRPDGSPVWTPLVAVSLMIFFVLACQCMSTVAIVRRETNSWRWPLFMVSYMLVLAYVASLITYQSGRFLGFS